MPKIYSYILVVLLLVGTSCNSMKDIAVIGIPMKFERTFDVAANDENGVFFQDNDTIDFTENEDVAANLDNINRYEIKSITYVVTDVVSDADAPLLLNGKVTFSSLDNEGTNIVSVVENLDLKKTQEDTAEAGQDLPFSTEDLELLSEILVAGNKIDLSYEASMDTVVSFSVTVTLALSLKIGI